MALSFGVAFVITYDPDSLLAGMPLDEQLDAVEGMLRSTLLDNTGHREISRIEVHPDPEAVFPEPEDDGRCDCSDGGAGYLVGMTGGRGGAPIGAVTIQACNECRGFDLDDVKAALAYANQHGGRVHAIGDGTAPAFATDVWVMPDEPWMINHVEWHTEADAIAAGWIEAEDATRETRLQGLIEKFMDDQDAGDVTSTGGRYCLVERHVPAGYHWLTLGDDPQALAAYNVDQEMAENWAIEMIVDLETGEQVTARVEVELG